MHALTKGILLFAVVTVGLAAAGAADVAAAEGDLTIEVTETDAEPLVTVTSNDTAVGNASVNVTTADGQNVTYVGEGDHETDANGTVTLPAAEDNVTVNVTATDGNASATTTVDLEAPASLAVDVSDTNAEPLMTVTSNDTAVENASVNVTTAEGQNVTYVGEGDYETDANGTVTLPAAEENVTVDVTAAVDNETATTIADLVVAEDESAEEPDNFGQLIREFIKGIGDRSGGIGDAVSDFATSNNPGNAPDHAGGPGNASDAPGNASANASDDRQGPPDHAGGNGADDRSGNGTDGADGDDADDDAETESNSSDDSGGAPGNSGNAPGNGGNGGGGSGDNGGGPGNGNGPGN